MKTKMQYGKRPVLRDKILELLADGDEWHINDIERELQWPTTTSISKTLVEIKERLVLNRDSRRLHRRKYSNAQLGTTWWLTERES